MAAPERQYQELNMDDEALQTNVIESDSANAAQQPLTDPNVDQDPLFSDTEEQDVENLPSADSSSEAQNVQIQQANPSRFGFLDIVDFLAQKSVILMLIGMIGVLCTYTIRYTEKFKSFDQEYLENHLDSKLGNILWTVGTIIFFAILAKIILGIKGKNAEVHDESGQNSNGVDRNGQDGNSKSRNSKSRNSQDKNNLTDQLTQKRMYILLGITCVYYFVVSLIWVKLSHSYPYGDQLSIVSSAEAFQYGNFESLGMGGYMDMAPHQLGLALLIEGLYKIFGNGKYYLYQYVNACFMPLLVFSGYKVTELVFQSKKVCLYYLFLMIGCVQLIFYVPYIYGEMGSMALMMTEAWMVIGYCKLSSRVRRENTGDDQQIRRYFRTQRIAYIIGIVITSTLAIMVRENSLIFLIAVTAVLLVHTLKERNPRVLVCIALVVLAYFALNTGVAKLYENRSGIESSEGIPATAYIAMGLQDAWPGPGWYNNYNKECYQQSGFLTVVADSMAKANINERIAAFMLNRPAAIEFFKQKFQTQWNEPTFEAFWVNHNFEGQMPEDSLVMRIFEGDLNGRLEDFMNRSQFIVYAMFLVAMIALLLDRKRHIYDLLLAVGILGGFFFSMLWEAKSRYILPYYVFMLIYAAYGIYIIQALVAKLIGGYFAGRPEMLDAARIDADASINDANLGGFDDARPATEKTKRGRILNFRNRKK